MTEIWILKTVTLPFGELLCYFILMFTFAILAGLGWSLYIVEKRKRLRLIISGLCPFVKKKDGTAIINKP
jgi:hypothetical protein